MAYGTEDEEEEKDGGDGDIDCDGRPTAQTGSCGRIRWTRKFSTYGGSTHGWSLLGGVLVTG